MSVCDASFVMDGGAGLVYVTSSGTPLARWGWFEIKKDYWNDSHTAPQRMMHTALRPLQSIS
jgi:hypothetical protein